MTGKFYLRDLRAAGVCLDTPTRAWAAERGIDWRTFCRDGWPVETLENTGEAVAMRVAKIAREREARGEPGRRK